MQTWLKRVINFAAAAAAASALLVGAESARASQLLAQVDISAQRMTVSIDGRPAYQWKVSTARRGYVTPTGSFRPTRLAAMWYSKKYDNSPMPHSVFFHGGYAVHATPYIKCLGSPASHGCIRLHPSNASDFYALVKTFGARNTSIVIVR